MHLILMLMKIKSLLSSFWDFLGLIGKNEEPDEHEAVEYHPDLGVHDQMMILMDKYEPEIVSKIQNMPIYEAHTVICEHLGIQAPEPTGIVRRSEFRVVKALKEKHGIS